MPGLTLIGQPENVCFSVRDGIGNAANIRNFIVWSWQCFFGRFF